LKLGNQQPERLFLSTFLPQKSTFNGLFRPNKIDFITFSTHKNQLFFQALPSTMRLEKTVLPQILALLSLIAS